MKHKTLDRLRDGMILCLLCGVLLLGSVANAYRWRAVEAEHELDAKVDALSREVVRFAKLVFPHGVPNDIGN